MAIILEPRDEPLSPATLRKVRRAMRALPILAKTVFLLSARDDLDHEEIGFLLSVPVSEVERLLAQALVAIDAALDTPKSH